MLHEQVDAVCPKCHSRYLRRSRHTGFFSKLMCDWKRQVPFRCMNCDLRFLIFMPKQEDVQSSAMK
jgi:DNA-directed RNA polymerase subunit RPC12/RpoP